MPEQGPAKKTDLPKVTRQLYRRLESRPPHLLSPGHFLSPTCSKCPSWPMFWQGAQLTVTFCRGGDRASPQQAASWVGGLSPSPLPHVRALGWRPSLRKARAGPPVITDGQHNMLRPPPAPPHSRGRPERGVHTLPKHLDFTERAKMHHPDVFKAPCWVSAESRQLGGGGCLCQRGEGAFVQRFRVVLAQSWGRGGGLATLVCEVGQMGFFG